jgi:tetratricopeptide (TPR) repeat protein
MIRWFGAVFLFQAATAFAVGPHVSFTRVVAARHDLGTVQSLAVIYAIGDNQKVTAFVENFVDYVGRAGTLRIENAVEDNRHLTGLDEKAVKRIRRQHPADAYISVSLFTCAGLERKAEGSERDVGGNRIRRLHVWLDATCSAKLDIRRDDGRRLISFMAHGEGTSPRVDSLTDEERNVAYEQAARYAALNAADSITPRVVRETIELDPTAPSFDEGLPMIYSEHFEEARRVWEAALRRYPNSSPLQFNLGVVCEAIGNRAAAKKYLEAAVRLSPRERRYRAELMLFQKRQ